MALKNVSGVPGRYPKMCHVQIRKWIMDENNKGKQKSGMLTLVTSTRTWSLMKGWNVTAFPMHFPSAFMLFALLPVSLLLLSRRKYDLT